MIPSRRTDHIFALDMWSVRFYSLISSKPRRVYFQLFYSEPCGIEQTMVYCNWFNKYIIFTIV